LVAGVELRALRKSAGNLCTMPATFSFFITQRMDQADLKKENVPHFLASICDHRPPDNIACPQEVEALVDVLEANSLDDVADLASLSQGNHFA
jgi:hypothetical protein